MALFKKKTPNQLFFEKAQLKYNLLFMVPISRLYKEPVDDSEVERRDLIRLENLKDRIEPYTITIQYGKKTLWDGPAKIVFLDALGEPVALVREIYAMAAVLIELPVKYPFKLGLDPVELKVRIQSKYEAESKPQPVKLVPMIFSDFPVGYTYCREGVWSVKSTLLSSLDPYSIYPHVEGYYKTGENSAIFTGCFIYDPMNSGMLTSGTKPFNFKHIERLPSDWELPSWEQMGYVLKNGSFGHPSFNN